MSFSSKNYFCFICSVGVPEKSKRHSSFERNSSTFNLLSELLRIETIEIEGNGGVVENFVGIQSDSKFYSNNFVMLMFINYSRLDKTTGTFGKYKKINSKEGTVDKKYFS